MSFRPRLRAEISCDEGALRDPLAGMVHPLDGLQRLVVARLDGERTAEAVVDEVAAVENTPRPVVEHALRRLLLLGVTEGAGDPIRVLLARARAGEPPAARVLPGSRFACQGSGSCCRAYVFGPLTDEDIARIEALDVLGAMPNLRGQALLTVEETPSAGRVVHLATVGERCIFLRGDELCGLHAAFGAAAKPGFCQLYPIEALPTALGMKVYDRGECASFAVSATTGPLLADELPRLAPNFPRGRLHHPSVLISGRTRCDYGHVLALVAHLDGEVELAPTALAALRITVRRAHAFAAALSRCPIADGQPDGVVAALLRTPPSELRAAAPIAPGLAALAAVLRALAPLVTLATPIGPRFRSAVALLAEIVAARTGTDAAASSFRATSHRTLAVAVGSECDALARLSLRQQIFGRRFLVDDRLPAGILRIALGHAIAQLSAQSSAAADGAGAVTPSHFSIGHMVAQRALSRPSLRAVLRAHGHHAWSIAEALPMVLAGDAS